MWRMRSDLAPWLGSGSPEYPGNPPSPVGVTATVCCINAKTFELTTAKQKLTFGNGVDVGRT